MSNIVYEFFSGDRAVRDETIGNSTAPIFAMRLLMGCTGERELLECGLRKIEDGVTSRTTVTLTGDGKCFFTEGEFKKEG